jgi:hypothetical protein
MLKNHLEGALEPLSEQSSKIDVWLEQQVWGHRFYNDQTPWLVLLEALGIMACRNADKNNDRIFPGLEGGRHERFTYSMAPRRELRAILFKDRHIDEIADSDEFGSDNTRWARWFDRIGTGGRGEAQFGYLKDRFTRFSSFRNAVALLRSAEVESGRKRRATSRHLAPRGPAMLAADYGETKSDTANKDRRFFARGGELLYLMLNRSSLRERLEPLVAARLLTENSRWNALAKVMQPKEQGQSLDFDVGYLPMPSHPGYDRIAEDWASVLSLTELPDDHVPEPLMRLTGLGIIRYMVERASEVLGTPPPPIPLDMVAASTVGVKRISQDCFRRHRDMTRSAIVKLTEDFAASPEWKEALAMPNKARAANDLVAQRFGFAWGETDFRPDPEEYPAHIAREAIADHDQHLGRVIGFYAEQIGLAVAVRGSGRWYAASDGLLEALVLANVREPLEFEIFLRKLWDRYGIVVGSEVGRDAFEAANYGHFKANQRLLEERLRVLGLVHRLSDDCAFVHNPFFEVAK